MAPSATMPHELFERTLDQAIEDLAGHHAGPGYRFEDDAGSLLDISFAGLEHRSAQMAAGLQALGGRPGDRVLLVLPAPAEFVPIFLGAVRAGLVPVPLATPIGFGSGERYIDTVARAVEHCQASFLVTDARLSSSLGGLAARHPQICLLAASELEGDARFQPCRRQPDDVCFIQYTSGSTGRHRGVVIRHGNVASNARSISQAFGDGGLELGVDQAVTWLPLIHDMGLIGHVILPVFTRNPITMLTPLTFLKRPKRWLAAISRQRASISFAPNFAYALAARRLRPADLADLDLSCWKLAGCGAEPIRPRDLKHFAAVTAAAGFDPRALTPAYGLAEATLAVSLESGAGMILDRIDSEALQLEGRAQPAAPGASAVEIPACGKPLWGGRAAVFGLDDPESLAPLPERRVGELRLQGPSVTTGYLGSPPGDPVLFAGSWLRTGDQAYMADGRIYICGRIKDLIIVNGRNYRPEDIEWAAAEAEGVFGKLVMAFSVSAEGGPEQVVVAVETIASDPVVRRGVARAVKRDIHEALGLVVSEVLPVDRGALPRTTSGKLQRFVARDQYLSGELTKPVRERRAASVAQGYPRR